MKKNDRRQSPSDLNAFLCPFNERDFFVISAQVTGLLRLRLASGEERESRRKQPEQNERRFDGLPCFVGFAGHCFALSMRAYKKP